MAYGGYGNDGGYGQIQDQRSPYGAQGQQGYGNDRYGGQQQPQQQQQQSGRGGYDNGYSSGNGYGRQDVEMNNRQPTNYQSNPYDDRGEDSYGPPAGGLPSRPAGGMAAADILEQCTQIDRAISDIESRLQNFKGLQSRILSDRAAITDLDGASSDLMTQYRNLAARMKKIKSDPDSGSPRNVAQVGRVDRRLKSAINEFQRLESDFRSQMRDQQARQYRIVNPNATEEEVREVVEDPNAQVFQQALLNSDRRGQSQSAINAVRQRHEAIQNIEQTMIELAELFQDLDTLVLQQEVQVKQIEDSGEEVFQDLEKANVELDLGVKSARGARKKKWICLFLTIFIIIAIAVAVAVYILITKKAAKTVTGV